jgi:hypothetical protein
VSIIHQFATPLSFLLLGFTAWGLLIGSPGRYHICGSGIGQTSLLALAHTKESELESNKLRACVCMVGGKWLVAATG